MGHDHQSAVRARPLGHQVLSKPRHPFHIQVVRGLIENQQFDIGGIPVSEAAGLEAAPR